MYIIQCLLYCMNACEGKLALAPQLLAVCLLDFVYLIDGGNHQRWFLLCVESLMHLKRCICFTETEKNPFSSSIVFAQSLTCVFFPPLSGKSLDSPNTAQGADRKKVLFEGGNQSLLMLISFPTKNLRKERCGETK